MIVSTCRNQRPLAIQERGTGKKKKKKKAGTPTCHFKAEHGGHFSERKLKNNQKISQTS
jgi:hypothetical protein